jgi:trimethylamine monooxygenase
MPSYMPRMGLKSYFTKRFEKHDIKKYIRFETIATDIQFNQETKQFSAVIKDLKN